MKERILNIINDNDYQPLTINGFFDKLGVNTSNEKAEVIAILDSLIEDYIIVKNNKERFVHLNEEGFYVGKINVKAQGYGFVATESLVNDLFVPKDKINGALNNDIVLVKKVHSKENGKSDTAKVEKVIKRDLTFIIGDIYKFKSEYFLKSDDVSLKMRIKIDDLSYASVDHKVKAKVKEFINDELIIVDVVDILGHKNDIGIDITSIAYQHNFNPDFSEEALEQVKYLEDNIAFEMKRRKDLTDRLTFTIDGADAKDLDDAVMIDVLPNGNYLLGIYIADVSYYVNESSPLDLEAYRRSTSVYLVDRVIPMLPQKISNDLCSLNPDEVRLVIACEIELTHDGKVVSSDIFEGYIKSKARLNYADVNMIIEGSKTIEDRDLLDSILLMNDLSLKLFQNRISRGSLEFDIPESKIIVDDEGKVVDIELRERKRAERIIEEFMILANETIATRIFWLELPFIYRVHAEPDILKLKSFLEITKNLGYHFKVKGSQVTPKDLQTILKNIGEDDQGLNVVLLRMMAKAKYSEKNIGHYGLASPIYTHFTAPIRRYSDLMVHRLIRTYLFEHKIDPETVEKYLEVVVATSIQTSERERAAIDCENEVNDMKKAEYMEQFIGHTFTGTVSSITNFGMFVSLPNTVEGLVHVLDMKDDYYEYDEKFMILIGRRTKKKYRIGDTVRVKVISANKELREVNFQVIYKKNKKKNGGKRYVKGRKENHYKKQKSKT